jgi:hypothetical protein
MNLLAQERSINPLGTCSTMAQNFSPFLQAAADPNDLYRVAWDFLQGLSANTAAPAFSNFFGGSLLNGVSTKWSAFLSSAPLGFENTLLRCVNANLRYFHPRITQMLYADPMIGVALNRAKTDRSDLRIMPAAFAPILAYSFNASLVDTFGAPDAVTAVAAGQLVLLALRNSSSTMANQGLGSYDDAIVVVKGVGVARTSVTFPACTEPSAQYAQRAENKPNTKTGERVDARYASVIKKKDKAGNYKTDGVDMNLDGILDAGRLIEGTYQYTEKTGGHLGARAFRVGYRTQKGKKSIFVSGPTQVAERDTDGDGRFSSADANRIDPTGAETTMYIHQGGSDAGATANTWSAGCQTIPKNRYPAFLGHVPGNATFYYVLINATA